LLVVKKSGGANSGPAGQGFIFDAAFVSAKSDQRGAEDAAKIGISSLGGEGLMVPKRRTLSPEVQGLQVTNETNRVRDSGIEEADFARLTIQNEGLDRSAGVGDTHFEANGIVQAFGGNLTGLGLEGNFQPEMSADLPGKPGKTARAIPAHLSLAAVGIVIPHPKIGLGPGGLHDQNSICADPAVTVTEKRNFGPSQRERSVAIVEHDKVVARAIHFGERKLHQ